MSTKQLAPNLLIYAMRYYFALTSVRLSAHVEVPNPPLPKLNWLTLANAANLALRPTCLFFIYLTLRNLGMFTARLYTERWSV
uniref:Uncharacterized protein n=1 Tax=Oscillatoriales cyanobacterium SpSt-402 TaxID=2282168 RepID=A0A832H5L7_9CYAN